MDTIRCLLVLFVLSVLLLSLSVGAVRIPVTHKPSKHIQIERTYADDGELAHPLKQVSDQVSNYVKHKFKKLEMDTNSTNKIPVSGFLQGEYYTSLFLGSPPSPFILQLDTGSSFTAIPQTGCTSCSAHPDTYNPRNSSTSIPISCNSNICTHKGCYEQSLCGFSCEYGDNSAISGVINIDRANFGTFNVTIPFGGILNSTKGFEPHDVDGIMGLAYANLGCVPNCITPILDIIIKNYSLPNHFTLFLNGADDSYLEIGEDLTNDEIFTPISNPSFYEVDYDSLELNGNSFGASLASSAIVDSGTTLWVMPLALYDELKLRFTTCTEEIYGMCQSEKNIFTHNFEKEMFYNKTNNLSDYPNIYLKLNGAELTIPPSNYLISQNGEIGTGITYSYDDLMILGDVVMKGFVVTFDRENQRVGWMREGFVNSYSNGSSSKMPAWGWVLVALGAACAVIFVGVVAVHFIRRSRKVSSYRIIN